MEIHERKIVTVEFSLSLESMLIWSEMGQKRNMREVNCGVTRYSMNQAKSGKYGNNTGLCVS